MSISTHIRGNLVEIFKIFIITLLLLLINAGIVFISSKNYIKEHWETYRCNPLIIPFASFFGHNAFDNFGQCLFVSTAGFTNIFLQPIHYMFKIITKIFSSFSKSIQDIRKVILKIRVFFQWIVKDVMQRFQDGAATLQFFFAKLKDIFAKSYAIFITIGYMMFTTYQSFLSMWNGPIGWTARTLCFDGNTKVILKNKELKKIKDIKFSDKLYIGENVYAIMKFNAKNQQMYNYKGTIISGSHSVKENNKWVRIEDSEYSKKIIYNKKYIYCLITRNNRIIVKNNYNIIEFADFIETNDNYKNNMIKEITASYLNNKKCLNPYRLNINKNEKDYYLGGFSKNTLLKMNNGIYKNIKDIRIGEKTLLGRITGKIKQKIIDNSKIYKINTGLQNIFVSGKQLIKYNNEWIKIDDYPDKVYCPNKLNYLYHVCIENNIINIDNILFRDYVEDSRKCINNFIDNTVNKHNL